MNIGPYTFEEFLERATEFHGYPAPGLMIGGYMVELARSGLPEGILFEAVVETPKCLPDAVQLLTLCSIGNGRLKIVNWGLYALTLFEKFTGEGARVHIDPASLEHWPEIRSWFFKLKPRNEQKRERLFEEINEAGASICGIKSVKVGESLMGRKNMGDIGICTGCKEAYPKADGDICIKCQGKKYFMETGPYEDTI